jgi:hypothetical protein
MGKNLLRILTAGLVGIVVAIGAAVMESPAPGGLSAPIWGLITSAVKIVVDLIVAKVGPTVSTPPGPTTLRSIGLILLLLGNLALLEILARGPQLRL